jgi:hypothetical protein
MHMPHKPLSLMLVGILALALMSCASVGSSGTKPTPTGIGGACLISSGPPYQNVRVSDDTFLAHSEPMVAINPKNPLNLVGGSKFFTDPVHYRFQIGTYASHDGGCTWHDGGLLPGFSNPTSTLTSDVTFAFDAHNTAYVAVLNTNGNESGISVARSTDGGDTFGPPVSVFDDTQGHVFSDKPWIGIDTTGGAHDGAIYIVWSYDPDQPPCGENGPACDQQLAFARSTDGGQTFSKVQLIEGSAPVCTFAVLGRPRDSRLCDGALGATPAILPDGTIAVVYSYYDLPNNAAKYVLVVTSHDGGTTWSAPSIVAQVHPSPGRFPPANFRDTTLPAFAADPVTGQIYVAWTDMQNNEPDILLATSTDEGKTWSAPAKVNDDPAGKGAIHIQPQLAVAPNGTVSVSFFDSRTSLTANLLDVFLAQSVNHGQSFLPNQRVTTQTWDTNVDEPKDNEGGNGFIGDYQGLAATNDYVHPFWNDTRTGSQEIFTAAVPSAKP